MNTKVLNVLKGLLTWLILPAAIIVLAVLIVKSVMEPIEFNKQKDYRESIAIQQLKDIRSLQVAYKSENGKFVSTVDSLKTFYETGRIKVVMQIGSLDDSAAVANTQLLKKRNPRIKPEDMLKLYREKGERLVFKIESTIPVKDSLFNDRPDFSIDRLALIPFSNGDSVKMEATVKMVSGVKVPLFEASMPYKSLLKGLDNQLRINLDAERNETGRYPGLKVGSITAPNNNAGNWE